MCIIFHCDTRDGHLLFIRRNTIKEVAELCQLYNNMLIIDTHVACVLRKYTNAIGISMTKFEDRRTPFFSIHFGRDFETTCSNKSQAFLLLPRSLIDTIIYPLYFYISPLRIDNDYIKITVSKFAKMCETKSKGQYISPMVPSFISYTFLWPRVKCCPDPAG